jgi:hypothetical protein
VPKLIMAVVAAAVIVFGIKASLPAPATRTPAPAPVAAPVADTAATPAPAVQAPAPAASVPKAAPAKPPAVTAAPVVAKLEPNVFLDLPDNLSEGTLTLDVDGKKTWTQKIAGDVKRGSDAKGRPEVKGGELYVPDGPHKVTVTLLNPDGKVKETRSTSLSILPGTPLTLRVRLSRFKKDLELQAVARKPSVATTAASAKPGAVSNDKAKAAAAKPVAKP